MSFYDCLSLAFRYEIDHQPQSAWRFGDIPQVIEALANEGFVITKLVLAFSVDGKVSEEFPLVNQSLENAFPEQLLIKVDGFNNSTVYQIISELIPRNLKETWSEFVLRAEKEALEKQALLQRSLFESKEIEIPSNSELLCRLAWASETEWEEKFGRNLINLIEGDISHPEIGQDENEITYQFLYPGNHSSQGRMNNGGDFHINGSFIPTTKTGRKIFYLAEDICENLETIKSLLFPFLISERKEVLPEEDIFPEIISFTLKYNEGWEGIRVFITLNDANPDNEPLYQYWKVEMIDQKEFRLI